jgi:phage terminase large subunit
MADSTVIWFFQVCGRETRVIDVLKGEGEGLEWYANEVLNRPARHGRDAGQWVWGTHYLPHDAEVRELGSGKSRVETLAGLGVRATICPNIPVEDGIQAVRGLLPTCWFDKEKCKKGIEALRMYRRHFDQKGQEFSIRPLHDWTSHYADAFRYFAVGHREIPLFIRRIKKRDLRWVV